MENLITIQAIATRSGRDPASLRRVAMRLVAQGRLTRTPGRDWLLTEDEAQLVLSSLRPSAGRPAKENRNDAQN